jgi:hypothetical protein
MNTIEEFWSYVTIAGPDECWLWQRAKTRKGYGVLYLGKTCWFAHRLAYTNRKDDIPNGMFVCHTCDNPPCCNPAHLWLGNNSQNTLDSTVKNRRSRQRGTTNPANKLTEQQVLSIRAEYVPKLMGYKKLAKRYGVHPRTIKDILIRRTWTWL